MNLAYPAALWLFPLAVTVLILLQLYRSRRREIVAGSLLLWRRVAARERVPARRRVVLDRSFWLQTAVLAALVLALSAPRWIAARPPGRRLALLVDNGPSARAVLPDGRRVWQDVLAAARGVLAKLGASDRVALIAAAPRPRRLDGGAGLPPAEALSKLDALRPALSEGPPEAAWLFALDAARSFSAANDSTPVPTLAFSPRSRPPGAAGGKDTRALWRVAGPGPVLKNVALTAFGSTLIPRDAESSGNGAFEVLVQVRNFSKTPRSGKVECVSLAKEQPFRLERAVSLKAGAVRGVPFRMARRGPRAPPPPLRLAWIAPGGADALPEDDMLSAAPRPRSAPRARLHGQAPHVADLYRSALGAEVLAADRAGAVDLEIHVDRVPDAVPPSARALLLLAPAQSYGAFEVLREVLARPVPRRGEDDPLIAGLQDTPRGLGFPILEARALKAAGDLKALLWDRQGRPLAARFRLADGRPAYVLAFVPGNGPRERKLHPALAAFLLRILKEAAGTREPYAVRTAAALERASGQALPLDWKPGLDAERGTGVGVGVLSAEASALPLAKPSAKTLAMDSWLPVPLPGAYPLWPYLVLLAVLLMLLEMGWERVPAPSAHFPPTK